MAAIIFNLFADQTLVDSIQKKLHCAHGDLVCRRFPDGESYIRVESNVAGQDVIVVCDLVQPDSKILPLLFFCDTVKSLGAKSVGLVAPYLAYMRQDVRFQTGEGITSNYFAALISRYFSWMVTIDPHLHRHHALSEIYSIPALALHATHLIAEWVKAHVSHPLLIGPDQESDQWVSTVAQMVQAPYLVLEKVRLGDRSVEITKPEVAEYTQHTPVLIDDIISTAKTMIKTVQHLAALGMRAPVCIGVHAIFVDQAYQELQHAGVAAVVTANTIKHPSNQIDVSELLAEAISGIIPQYLN